jgi:hypothetical protein
MAMCRIFEHLPSHGIQLDMNLMGHMKMGIIVQQDFAITELNMVFVLDLSMLLVKRLTAAVCISHILDLKYVSGHALMSLWSCLGAVLHSYLLVCLPSHTHGCAIYTATAVPRMGLSCT